MYFNANTQKPFASQTLRKTRYTSIKIKYNIYAIWLCVITKQKPESRETRKNREYGAL